VNRQNAVRSAELLKITLSDQTLDIALADIELAILGEIDSSATMC
jgi:hypothetical protein